MTHIQPDESPTLSESASYDQSDSLAYASMTSSEEIVYNQNKKSIFYLLICILYITFTTIFCKSSNELSNQLFGPDKSASDHDTGSCHIDSNKKLDNFMYGILIPTFVLRVYGMQKYRDYPEGYKTYANKLYLLFNISYGAWTVMNIMTYRRLSSNCKGLNSLTLISYEVFLIIGCIPATNVLFFALIIIIIIPLIVWNFYQRHQESQKTQLE